MENTDSITFSQLLDNIDDDKCLFKLIYGSPLIEIDKESYSLSYKHVCKLISKIDNVPLLNLIKFDFNSINFNIEIHKLSEYINLLKSNNDIIKQKCENININNLNIDYTKANKYDNYYFNLDIIKHLEDKNFNFELLPLSIILHNDLTSIEYLIKNNLYDFLKKDKYEIIKYCRPDTFKFFISYLNLDVYTDYDGNSFYKLIDDYLYINKFEILYKEYKLFINYKDILDCSLKLCSCIFMFYDINDIINYDETFLYTLLIKCITYTHFSIIKDKLFKVIEILNSIDIEFLITILKDDNIMKNFIDGDIDEQLFKNIINKINMDLYDIISNIKKQLTLKQVFIFYYIYNRYYDNNINNYIETIFTYQDIENLNNTDLYYKSPYNSNIIKIFNNLKSYFE